jgi:hypothetical protein
MADRKKILICRVDDDAPLLEELKELLEGAGVEVRDDLVPIAELTDSEAEEQIQLGDRIRDPAWEACRWRLRPRCKKRGYAIRPCGLRRCYGAQIAGPPDHRHS